MKYISLDSVVAAFSNNTQKTTDGFWGIIAILFSLNGKIADCKVYELDGQKIANQLERWFSVRDTYKVYNSSASWFVMFSSQWKEQLSIFLKQGVNIYDVITWAYQHVPFENEPTKQELLSKFMSDTSLSIEELKNLFDFSHRDILFSDYNFSQQQKINEFEQRFGENGNNNSIKSNGSYIVAEAGMFQRAPFTQTLYASNENFKCLMITNASPTDYYPAYFCNGSTKGSLNSTRLLNEPLQIIYYGAPGTGKSYAIDNATAQYGSVRTTFHPDSDYASFVGAYKPTMEDVPINSIYGESVQFATGKNGHPGTEKKIVYKYVPQAFLKAYVAAWSNLSEPYFLVIEEINRGNCAQIFGDLFQLLDRNNSGSSSYAIHADEDIMQFLGSDSKGFAALSDEQKDAIRSFVLTKDSGATVDLGQKILDGELLLLPPNLYIWATMNTSDQSLFPIDSAFKRRWNWRYMPIDTQKENWTFEIKGTRYSWGQFLEKINPEIYSLTESSDKQMGYFFAKADPKTGVISEEVFLNKVLFYLWTDVFKDYDVSSELFKNKEKNRSFRFIDFFDKEQPNALQNFIDNLGLDAIEIDIDSIDDEDTPEDGSTPNTPGQKDRSRYSINGEGEYNKRQTVLRSLRKYVENNPTMTATEVIENWKSVNPQLPYFILSADEYEARVSELKTQRDRYWSVAAANGEKVYITNQWNVPRINNFIELINNSDFGIHIEKVSE